MYTHVLHRLSCDITSSHKVARDITDEILWTIHEQMEPIDELDYIANLRKCETYMDTAPFRTMVLFGGCEVKEHIDQAVT